MNLSNIDKLLIGFFCSIFIMASYTLLNRSSSIPDDETNIIGKVFSSTNNVKKKKFDNLNWHPISEGYPIVKDDYIFTGENSQVSIEFENKNKIEIDENSLIHLKDYDSFPSIEIENGTLRGEAKDQKLQIALKGSKKVVKAFNGSFTINKVKKAIGIRVNSGTIELKSKEKLTKVNKGQTAKIERGKIKIFTNRIFISKIYHDGKDLFLNWSSQIKGRPPFIIQFFDSTKNLITKESTRSSHLMTKMNPKFAFVKISKLNEKNEAISTSYRRIRSFVKLKKESLAESRKAVTKPSNHKKESFKETWNKNIVQPIKKLFKNDEKRKLIKEKTK